MLFRIVTFLCLTLIPVLALGQYRNLKDGAYRNFEDFKNNKPFASFKKIEVRTFSHNGIALYSLKTRPSLSRETIKFKVWVIKDQDSLFLNTTRAGLVEGFVKIGIPNVMYTYFEAPSYRSNKEMHHKALSPLQYGVSGVVYATVKSTLVSTPPSDHVLNFKTGGVFILRETFIFRILKYHPRLLEAYVQEPNNTSREVMLKYLDLANQLPENIKLVD